MKKYSCYNQRDRWHNREHRVALNDSKSRVRTARKKACIKQIGRKLRSKFYTLNGTSKDSRRSPRSLCYRASLFARQIQMQIDRLSFKRDVTAAGGIPGYRFSPPTDVFTSVENLPSQQCFCPAGPPCAPEGTFNVSLCQYDSPILLTFPHFYLGK